MPAGNLHIPQGRFYGVVQYEEIGGGAFMLPLIDIERMVL